MNEVATACEWSSIESRYAWAYRELDGAELNLIWIEQQRDRFEVEFWDKRGRTGINGDWTQAVFAPDGLSLEEVKAWAVTVYRLEHAL